MNIEEDVGMLNKLTNVILKPVFVILWSFLSLSVAVYAMNGEEESPVIRVRNAIEKINTAIEKDAIEVGAQNYHSIYIALGLTGVGKSTLINFLGGKQIKAVAPTGVRVIDIVGESFKGIEVGHDTISKTAVPAYWHDAANGIIYYDAPGFVDTGSPIRTKEEAEITNAFAIYKLFATFPRDRIKIMLTIPEDHIKDRGTGIRETVTTMGQFFRNNLADVARGTCVIVTKQDEYDAPEDARMRLGAIAREGQGAFAPPSLGFLQNLAGRLEGERLIEGSKIAFFPKPTRDERGRILEGGGWETAKREIATALRDTAYLNNNIVPTLAISEKAKEYVDSLSKDEIDAKMREFISTICINGIKEHCKRKILNNQDSPQVIRTYFVDLANRIANLNTSDLTTFKHGMEELLRECELNDLTLRKLTSLIDYGIFFKQLNPETTYKINEWADTLSAIKRHLLMLGKDPVILDGYDEDGKDLTSLRIVGFLVGVSDIPESIINLGEYNGRKNIKRVDLYGINTIYLDKNLINHGKENENGLSFDFIAPNWQIIAPRTIDSSGGIGSDGVNGANGNTSGAHGSNGTPGKPGGNGGNFYGKGINFTDIKNLTINTSGGKGGRGGNGGNGADGLVGQNGDLNVVTRTEQFRMILNFEQIHEYHEQLGTAGTNGGNAGQGGIGGIGGKNGSVVIDGAEAKWTCNATEGNAGDPGTHGMAGRKGKHGDHSHGCICRLLPSGKQFNVITPLGHHPSAKGTLFDGQPANAHNVDRREEPQAFSLRKEQLIEVYSGLYNSYVTKDPHNPFIAPWDINADNT